MNIIEKKRNTLFGLDYFDVYGVYAPGQGGGVTADPITFYLPLTASGLANLSTNLTINGQTVAPTCRYEGKNATTASWTATVGENLTGVGSGGTVNKGVPLTDNTDKAADGNGTRYWTASTDQETGTDDFVIEAVAQFNTVAYGHIFATRHASKGIFLRRDASNARFTGTARGVDGTANFFTDVGMVEGAWYHIMVFFDKSGSVQFYINGVASAAAVDVSGVGNIDDDGPPALGASPGGSGISDGGIAYVAYWQAANWLDTHLQPVIAAERFQRLCGFYPETAKGTTAPTVTTRASTAVLDKYNAAGEKKHFNVGNNWMRLCNRNDSNDVSFTGYLSETAATTLVSNISLPLTGGASVAITGSQTGTFDGATAFRIDEAITNGSHYVNFDTNTVASDEEYVMSIYASGSGRNVIRMLSPQPAHLPCEAFFVLNGTGSYAVGMGKGSGSSIEACGNGWYRCQVWSKSAVGASAGVDMFVMLVKDDWDQTYQGVAETGVHIWCPQLELGTVATSPLLSAGSYATRVQDELEFKGDDGNVPKNGIPTKIAISASCLLRDDDQPIYRYLLSVADSYDRLVLIGNQTSGNARFLSYVAVGNDGNALTTKNIQDNTIHDLRASMETGSSAIIADGTHTGYDATADIIDATHQFNEISVGKYATIGSNGLVNKIKIADE